MKTIFRSLLAFLVLGGVMMFSAVAKEPPGFKRSEGSVLDKTAQTKIAAILNINNFTIWQQGQGRGAYPPNNAGDGGYFPRGTRWAIFADGFVWSTKAYLDAAHTQPAPVQLIRTGGSTYNVGNEIGWIEGTGANATAIGAADSRARIYRIRRDYLEMSGGELRLDAAENFLTTTSAVTDADIALVKAQYAKDWDEWPVANGAPYIERNGIPGYQKPPAFEEDGSFTVDSLIAGNYDEPGLAGVDPNSPANQVIWSAMNDLNRGNLLGFSGTEPMGLEAQLTLWGYKRTDALGNLYFKKIKFINKGGADVTAGGQKGSLYLDSMYFAQWSDPDLGAFGDDISGCDINLSVGFVYNGNPVDAEYIKFNLPPPAVGYDFLAGPTVFTGVATDTAVFDLKKKAEHINLPMTSFSWFASGSPISDPPFNYEGALRWNRMLRGFVPDPSIQPERLYPSGPFPPSKFPLSGEPNIAGSGFVDGQGTDWSFSPGDRRIVLSTGPFTLAPDDTQEVVVGVVAGLGGDRISSVAVMKANDAAVQTTYDLLFQVSQPPAVPQPVATELDGQVIIEWGSNLGRVKQTEEEHAQPGDYVFEGYNVYQLPAPGSPRSEWRRLATYDLVNSVGVILSTEFDLDAAAFLQKPIQFGSNSGIKRHFVLNRDFVTGIDKLYNGQEYYLAVTAYSRPLELGFLEALESGANILTVRPKKPYGTEVNAKYGDALTVTHSAGGSDGIITASIADPGAVTGDTYEIRFDTTGGSISWMVRNATKNTTPVSGREDQVGDGPIVNGIQVTVDGPPLQGKDWSYAGASPPNVTPLVPGYNSGRWFTGGSGQGGEIFFEGVFMEPNFWGATTLGPADYKEVDVKWSPMQSFTDLNGNGAYNIGEPYVATTPHSQFAAMYQTFTGAAYRGQFRIPFTAWDVTNPASPIQLNVVVRDRDANGQWDLHSQVNDPLLPNNGDQRFNYTWITNVPYDTTYYGSGTDGRVDFFAAQGGNAVDGGMWVMWLNPRGTRHPLAEEATFTLIPNFVNTIADVFTYSTAGKQSTKNSALEKLSIDRIKAYPNPYYAFNAAETNRFVRFVTISNLPAKATVRIFNLAGHHVRTLTKDDATTQFLRWDLNNHDNFPVASGIYIAHLDLTLSDGSSATRILKIAIIQEQEVPDVF